MDSRLAGDGDGGVSPAALLVLGLAVLAVLVGGATVMGAQAQPTGEEIMDNVRASYESAETLSGTATVTVSNETASRTATMEFAAGPDNQSRVAITGENGTTIVMGTNGSAAWVYDPATGVTGVVTEADLEQLNESIHSGNATMRDFFEAGTWSGFAPKPALVGNTSWNASGVESWNASSFESWNASSFPGWNESEAKAWNASRHEEWNGSSFPEWNTSQYRDGQGSGLDHWNASAYEEYNETLFEPVRNGTDTVNGVETTVVDLVPTNDSIEVTGRLWIDTEEWLVTQARWTDGTHTLEVVYSDVRRNVSIHDSTFEPPAAADSPAAYGVRVFDTLAAAQDDTGLDLPQLGATGYEFDRAVVTSFGGATTVAQEYTSGAETVALVTTTDTTALAAANGTAVSVNGHPATASTMDGQTAVWWTEGNVTVGVLADGSVDDVVGLAEAVE
jgi:outer membrane lipoprotein-sorting protein